MESEQLLLEKMRKEAVSNYQKLLKTQEVEIDGQFKCIQNR